MLEQRAIVAEREADLEVEVEALAYTLHPLAAAPVAPRSAGFQLPRGVWMAMLSCYAVFFGAIAIATGGSGSARFAIVVSVLYTLVYFGVARIGARQAGAEETSPLKQGRMLDTWTGLMDRKAVYGQILIVPLAVAFFGVGIMIIVWAIGAGE